MSDAISQHKKMAMGKGAGGNYAKGGSVKPPNKMNFGPPAGGTGLPPKTGLNETPIEKVKRVNGVKGV